MRITDLLSEDGVLIHASVANKEEAIRMLAAGPDRFGVLTDPAMCQADILARESQGTTALPHGIAIPHCKSRGVSERGITAMTVPVGVDWNAPDGTRSRLIFLLVGPENDPGAYLEMLSSLLQMLMRNPGLTERLTDAKDSAEFIRLLREAETV